MTRLRIVSELPENCPNPLELLDAALGTWRCTKVANHSLLIRQEQPGAPTTFALVHHQTTCVVFGPDGLTLDSGGYRSSSTRDRIESVTSLWHVHVVEEPGGQWWLVRGPRRILFEDGITLPYSGELPEGIEQLPLDEYPMVKGWKYFREFSDEERLVPTGNIVALDILSGRTSDDGQYCYDAISTLDPEAEPNAAALGECEMTRAELNTYCMRTSKLTAMKIHPRLFDYLRDNCPVPPSDARAKEAQPPAKQVQERERSAAQGGR